ncbi:MAG: hypothetical protein WBA16_04175 [Nonlabens sp.]
MEPRVFHIRLFRILLITITMLLMTGMGLSYFVDINLVHYLQIDGLRISLLLSGLLWIYAIFIIWFKTTKSLWLKSVDTLLVTGGVLGMFIWLTWERTYKSRNRTFSLNRQQSTNLAE